MKKLLLLALAFGLMFVVACKGGKGGEDKPGFDSAEDAAKALFEAVNDGDDKAIEKAFADEATLKEYLECPKDKDLVKDVKEDIKEMKAEAKKLKGKITVKKTKKKDNAKFKKDDDVKGCKALKDFEIQEIKVKFVKKDGDKEKEKKEGVTAAKFGDRWFIVDD